MFAVMWIPQFQLQAALRGRPELHARAVGLVAGEGRHAPLSQMTEVARRSGVVPGMTPTQAMVGCPELKVVSRDRAAESVMRGLLLERARMVSPVIEATADGVVTMDVRTLPGSIDWERWAEALAVPYAGMYVRVGVAERPYLAWQAARQARPFRVVRDVEAFLRPLPVEEAEPGGAVLELLKLWGVGTLGQLAGLRREAVLARLGPEGGVLWDRATGRADRLLQAVGEEEVFEEGTDLEEAIEQLDPLLFLLRRFLDLLLERLASRHRVVRTMELRLGLADGTAHEKGFLLPEPTGDGGVLFRVLQTHLGQVRTESPVVSVRLLMEPGDPEGKQPDLFASRILSEKGMGETLARLMAMVGRDRVGVARLQETHRPDAFVLEPHAPEGGAEDGLEAPAMALRRFRPPMLAQVRLAAGEPVAFCGDSFEEEVRRVKGPWRLSGEWWEAERGWEREEWDVETVRGVLFRLARTKEGWWVEGIYD